MPMRDYLVRAFWGDRPESVEQCARRMSGVMQCLSRCHDALTGWRPQISPGERRMPPVIDPTDHDVLVELLLQGRNRTDIGRRIIPEFGFIVSFFNDPGPKGFVVLAHCGAYETGSPLPIANEVWIDFPAYEAAPEYLTPTLLARTLECVVQEFEPGWAFASPCDWTLGRVGPLEIGWLTYLPQSPSALPALPAGVQVRPWRRGSIISLPWDDRDPLGPAGDRLAGQVVEALLAAGLIPT